LDLSDIRGAPASARGGQRQERSQQHSEGQMSHSHRYKHIRFLTILYDLPFILWFSPFVGQTRKTLHILPRKAAMGLWAAVLSGFLETLKLGIGIKYSYY
jgi:hypothetical protein